MLQECWQEGLAATPHILTTSSVVSFLDLCQKLFGMDMPMRRNMYGSQSHMSWKDDMTDWEKPVRRSMEIVCESFREAVKQQAFTAPPVVQFDLDGPFRGTFQYTLETIELLTFEEFQRVE